MDWNHLYTNFDGRISRQPFWIGTLVLWAASIALSILAGIIVGSASTAMMLIQLVIGLAFLVPSLAVAVKRFHDRDKSGWWVLIIFIPLIGFIWYLVELGFLPGTPGPNRFGPDPLGSPAFPGRA
ncbi:MAG: hypothetical protein K0S06_1952 [Microvirga sp.]|jgi:uncharacterized membrane protein YhaH (DUF805 family)|nr:hypothetical protein [Microvirga sp.]